jgi:hypothetical protein
MRLYGFYSTFSSYSQIDFKKTMGYPDSALMGAIVALYEIGNEYILYCFKGI